jgi:hypothetical protein
MLQPKTLDSFFLQLEAVVLEANLGRWMITSNWFIIILNIHLTARHASDERHDELQSLHMPPCPLRRKRLAFR